MAQPPEYTRADALREYLTGASSDGGTQTNPSASFGNYRSSTEAMSLGINIFNAIPGVQILYIGGSNLIGNGTLSASDANHLAWQPNTYSGFGPPSYFVGDGDIGIVEAQGNPGAYLRIQATETFQSGAADILINWIPDGIFGFDEVSISQATSGESEYRATILRNESSNPVSALSRCISLLGTPQVSNSAHLSGSGAGIITTTGSFTTWPASGWCNVSSSSGTLKELIYYTSRTGTSLTVPSAGRGLLGTSATAGASTDVVSPVPGTAIALDINGVQSFGSAIETIANATTAPVGVTWNLGITSTGGLQVPILLPNQQIGIWMWRQIPPGAIATPFARTQVNTQFNAY